MREFSHSLLTDQPNKTGFVDIHDLSVLNIRSVDKAAVPVNKFNLQM